MPLHLDFNEGRVVWGEADPLQAPVVRLVALFDLRPEVMAEHLRNPFKVLRVADLVKTRVKLV